MRTPLRRDTHAAAARNRRALPTPLPRAVRAAHRTRRGRKLRTPLLRAASAVAPCCATLLCFLTVTSLAALRLRQQRSCQRSTLQLVSLSFVCDRLQRRQRHTPRCSTFAFEVYLQEARVQQHLQNQRSSLELRKNI